MRNTLTQPMPLTELDMHFDLTDLRLFLNICEKGSITAGAAASHLALPSASARLRGWRPRWARRCSAASGAA